MIEKITNSLWVKQLFATYTINIQILPIITCIYVKMIKLLPTIKKICKKKNNKKCWWEKFCDWFINKFIIFLNEKCCNFSIFFIIF